MLEQCYNESIKYGKTIKIGNKEIAGILPVFHHHKHQTDAADNTEIQLDPVAQDRLEGSRTDIESLILGVAVVDPDDGLPGTGLTHEMVIVGPGIDEVRMPCGCHIRQHCHHRQGGADQDGKNQDDTHLGAE